jgi:hypothetical protein
VYEGTSGNEAGIHNEIFKFTGLSSARAAEMKGKHKAKKSKTRLITTPSMRSIFRLPGQ